MEAGHGGPNKSGFVLLRSPRGWLLVVAALGMGAIAAASLSVLASSGGQPDGSADVRPPRTSAASHTAPSHAALPRTSAGEARLRSLETRMLGAEHAAEHARIGEIARSQSGQAPTVSMAAAPPQDPADVGRWTAEVRDPRRRGPRGDAAAPARSSTSPAPPRAARSCSTRSPRRRRRSIPPRSRGARTSRPTSSARASRSSTTAR